MTPKRMLAALLCTIAVMSVIFACITSDAQEKDFPGTISDSRDLEVYFFDPEAVLKALKQGDVYITPLTTSTPDEYINSNPPPVKSEAYLWKYDEYLKFADILRKEIWGDDAMLEWDLLRMSFDADCQDPLDGFSTADLYYFRVITLNGEDRYAGRQIQIRPLYGDVVSGSGTNYPRPFFGGWKNIDLRKLKITPDDVLQIAEKNGGKDFRITVNNKCWVFISYVAGDKGWFVSYRSHKGSNGFRMNIDPYTGEFRILGDQ